MKKIIFRRLSSLVRPRSKDQDQRNKEYILNVLLVAGLLLIIIFGFVIIFLSMLIEHNYYVDSRLSGIVISLLFLAGLLILSKIGSPRYSEVLLTSFFFLISTFLVFSYGIFQPEGILLFALTIVMSAIILGSRASFIVTILVSATLLGTYLLHSNALVKPDSSWIKIPPGIGDVIGFSAIFFVITTVTWLMCSQMQNSLERAKRSEQALKEQADKLEIKVEERSKELQQAQEEKINDLYRLAELGYTSTALFHDLANRITVLSMDIESLGTTRGDSDEIIKQAKDSIKLIEERFKMARQEVEERETPKSFIIEDELNDIIDSLSYKTKRQKVDVKLYFKIPRSTRLHGDRIGFRRIIDNLIGNAVFAYDDPLSDLDKRDVFVVVHWTKNGLAISVTDYGRGIKLEEVRNIFKPFYTTKKKGMGIGLFISKVLAEYQFDGKLSVDSEPGKGSTFTLTLPLPGLKEGGKTSA